jgi:hypothetical protein
MSFTDSGAEVIDRAEASLNSLIAEALKAKAYREVSALAALAEAIAAINPGRGKRLGTSAASASLDAGVGAGIVTPAEAPKASEPSWMRPKTS